MSADTPREKTRWTAKVDGEPQPGVVEAYTARDAAEAWAEFIDLRDEECEIELLAEGTEKAQWFTVQAETTYTVFKSDEPEDEP